MYIVTFAFDLGDCRAIYTGRIVGESDNCYKVTYFEPTVRELLSFDLPRTDVIGRGYCDVRMLPLAPVIVEQPNVPQHINQLLQPIYA